MMNISRWVVVGSTIACSMIYVAIATPSASASTNSDNFDKCLKLGGSAKACCAGSGGTYYPKPGGASVCVWTPDKKLSAPGGNPGEGHLYFPPTTGVEVSSVGSAGQSRAGVHGLQEELVYPDLSIQAITFTPTDSSPYGYTVTVENQGISTVDLSGVVAQGYYTATEDDWGNGNPACGSTFADGTTLAPGATIDLPVSCSEAPASGENWLVVKIDSTDVLTESDETNNITSIGLAPDLIIQAVTFTPTDNSPNRYTVTVKNQGASTADLTGVVAQGYYTATEDDWGNGNPACGSTFTDGTTLAPGATIDLPVPCSEAPAAGDYWLVVKIDSADVLTESDETNNIFNFSLNVVE